MGKEYDVREKNGKRKEVWKTLQKYEVCRKRKVYAIRERKHERFRKKQK